MQFKKNPTHTKSIIARVIQCRILSANIFVTFKSSAIFFHWEQDLRIWHKSICVPYFNAHLLCGRWRMCIQLTLQSASNEGENKPMLFTTNWINNAGECAAISKICVVISRIDVANFGLFLSTIIWWTRTDFYLKFGIESNPQYAGICVKASNHPSLKEKHTTDFQLFHCAAHFRQ